MLIVGTRKVGNRDPTTEQCTIESDIGALACNVCARMQIAAIFVLMNTLQVLSAAVITTHDSLQRSGSTGLRDLHHLADDRELWGEVFPSTGRLE